MYSNLHLISEPGSQQRLFQESISEETKIYRNLLKYELARCISIYDSKYSTRVDERKEERKANNSNLEEKDDQSVNIHMIIDCVKSSLFLLIKEGFNKENLELVKFLITNLDQAEAIDIGIYRFRNNLTNFCDNLLKEY